MSDIELFRKLKYWWNAKADQPPPRSPIHDIYAGDYYRYGVVRVLRGIWGFWCEHWKLIIPWTVAALAYFGLIPKP